MLLEICAHCDALVEFVEPFLRMSLPAQQRTLQRHSASLVTQQTMFIDQRLHFSGMSLYGCSIAQQERGNSGRPQGEGQAICVFGGSGAFYRFLYPVFGLVRVAAQGCGPSLKSSYGNAKIQGIGEGRFSIAYG